MLAFGRTLIYVVEIEIEIKNVWQPILPVHLGQLTRNPHSLETDPDILFDRLSERRKVRQMVKDF